MSLSEDSSSNHSKEDIESAKLTGNKYNRIFYRDELDKILDDPRTDDHKDILEWIEKEKLCLYSKEGDKDKGDSLIKILLEEVGNGHEVVERVLDSYMSTPSANINSNTFKVKMDFTGLMLDGEDKIDSGLMSLFRKKSGSGDSILHDIVELKLKYQEYFWDHYKNGFKGKKENCSKSFIGKFQSSNIINHLHFLFRFACPPRPRMFHCIEVEKGVAVLSCTYHPFLSVPGVLLYVHHSYLHGRPSNPAKSN